VGAAGVKDAHVGGVKETGGLAHRLVLLADRAVPDRHVVAAKGDHAAAHVDVGLVQHGLEQGRVFRFGPGKGGQGVALGALIVADEERLVVGKGGLIFGRCG
jgi:hypothetical protein